MIINFPTGLYSTVIPKGTAKGNVTFVISTTNPPRSDLYYPKVPLGIVQRKRQEINTDIIVRRRPLGDLVFTVSKANRQILGDNSKQYELGEVLEFNQSFGKTVEPMLVSTVSEIRHDTNILNYEKMGLTNQEIDLISTTAMGAQDKLADKLNELKRLRSNAEQEINVQQKNINELTKTIESLTISLDYLDGTGSQEVDNINTIISRLNQNRTKSFAARDKALEDANVYASEATKISNKLRQVGYLVK